MINFYNINIQVFWDMTPYMVMFPEFSEQLAACIFTFYVVTLLGLLSRWEWKQEYPPKPR